ncbi:MAG: ISKra4 family transposase, partial [Cyanobacteria bacterium J06642_11]
MDYELRVVVEKVAVSSQEVVQRDTLKVYDIEAPESILDLGLRHEEQISLLEKVQNSIL